MDAYVQHCINDADARSILVRELLVHVTSFFRDPDCFAALKDQIREQLRQLPSHHPEYRVWVAGCASGEEAYTVAMLIHEAQEEVGTALNIRIWATDLHPDSIHRASQGQYSIESLHSLGEERIARHVVMKHRHGSFVPAIRDMLVFAPHDVLSDPPFLHLDLLVCRNLLIYFREKTQEAVLHRLCSSLSRDGIMMLGRSEQLILDSYPLEAINTIHRLYRKSRDTSYSPYQDRTLPLCRHLPAAKRDHLADLEKVEEASIHSPTTSSDKLQAAIEACVEPGFIIDEHDALKYVFASAKDWFDWEGPTQGPIWQHLESDIALACESLVAGLRHDPHNHVARTILQRFSSDHSPGREVRLLARRIPAAKSIPSHDWFFISLSEELPVLSASSDQDTPELIAALQQRIEHLHSDLDNARSTIHGLRHDLANSNEELQATNEELQASNEELQSSNEELQSLNEELHSVNAELLAKNDILSDMASDLEHLLSANDTPKIFLDAEGSIRRFTRAAPRIFHLDDQDVGRPISAITGLLGSGQRLGRRIAELTTRDENGDSFQSEHLAEDGRWYLERLHINRDASGAISGFALSWIDIHWLKELQVSLQADQQRLQQTIAEQTQALREQRDLLQNFSNASPVMLWMSDADGQIIHANQSTIDYCGNLDSGHVRSIWPQLIHPDDAAREKASYCKAIDGHTAYAGEWRVRAHDGCYRWFKVQAVPRCDGNGAFLGYAGGLVDIDAEVGLRQEVQHIADRLSLIVEAAEIGLWDWDTTDNRLYWSPRTYVLHGLPASTNGDSPIQVEYAQEAIHPEDQAHWQRVVSDAMRHDTADDYRLTFRPAKPRDGIEWLLGIGRVLRNPDGVVTRLSGICLDITAQRHMEDQLAVALKQSQQVAEDKSRFLATMSHELRTPLNGILGLSEYLVPRLGDAEHRSCLSRIVQAGKGLLQLINDTLEFSRLESGRMQLYPEPCQMNQLVDHLAAIYQPLASSKDHCSISWQVAPEVPEWLLIDGKRTEQILNNLVGNALKFTPNGVVKVTVDWSTLLDGAQGTLHLRVQDTGVGIAPEHLSRLGDEFFQVANPLNHHPSAGTGLGLSIVNGLVVLMEGHWQVESQLGQGTTVTVALPCQACAAAPSPCSQVTVTAIPDCQGRHILIADDNELNLEVLVHMLEETGATLHTAGDGLEVLAICEQQPCDLILMDLQMPQMNGFEACTALRHSDNHTPVIAVSATDDPDTVHAALSTGMLAHLRKPIDRQALFTQVVAALDVATRPLPEASPLMNTSSNDQEGRAAEGSELRLLQDYLASPAFDLNQGLRLSERRTDFYLRMLQRFAQQLDTRFAPLAQMDTTASSDDIHHLVHTLKGSAGAVGAQRLVQVCQTLLRCHAAEENWDQANWAELQASLADTRDQLQRLFQHHQPAAPAQEYDPQVAFNEVVQRLERSAWIDDHLCDAACQYVAHITDAATAQHLRQLLQEVRGAEARDLIAQFPPSPPSSSAS